MPILHMNVDECRSLEVKIRNEKTEIDNQLSQINSAFNDLIPSKWTAPGADRFREIISTWQNNVKLESEKLPEFSARLNTTIANWEQTASQF